MNFWDELKRRNVVKVSVAYLALAWLIIQITSIAVPAMNLPLVMNKIVFFIGLIGFPFALFFAWAFELTPEGIKKTVEVENHLSIANVTGRKLDFMIIGLLIAGLSFVIWDSYLVTDDIQTDNLATTGKSTSIAVIPLVNMSSHSDNEFFAAGVHEEILTKLSYIKGLRVASRTSTLKYIDSDMSIRDIGQELGVRYVVEGSVRRMNNHVRVTAQLIDAKTDTHIWASNFDRELKDIFAIQSAIAEEISNSIHLEIQPSTVGKLKGMATQSVKAYDFYIKAQSIEASERESEDSLNRTRYLLQQAVKEDPDFVDAWGLLNEVCDHMIRNMHMANWYNNDAVKLAELTAEAKHALEKAVSLAPTNLETLLALASDYVAERSSSEYSKNRRKHIDQAIELYPDSGMPWYDLGWWYELDGDIKNADIAFRKGVEKDPFHARILQGTHIFYSGNNVPSDSDGSFSNLLYQRLENSVGGVSSFDKLGKLWRRFLVTADDSIYQDFGANLESDFVINLPFNVSRYASIFQSPIDIFLLHEDKVSISNDSSNIERVKFIDVNIILLEHYLREANNEKIDVIATKLLQLKNLQWQRGWEPYILKLSAFSYASIGKLEQANVLAQQIIEARSDNFDPYGMEAIIAMSYVDLDYAVELLFAEESKYENWLGMDYLAIDTATNWRLLSHPKVVSYYNTDGKWINYLSKRLPAYANSDKLKK
ncbi:hypothetical protein AADZ86_13410 [Colwelliaceae bacterium BS250]